MFIYQNNKIEQTEQIKSALDNIYFQKTIKEITENLSPRYTNKTYVSAVKNLSNIYAIGIPAGFCFIAIFHLLSNL